MKSFVEIFIDSVHLGGHQLDREWMVSITSRTISAQMNLYLDRSRKLINKPLFQKSIDIVSKKIPIKICLIERDPKWDERSEISTFLDISKDEASFVFKIPVKGSGRREKKKSLSVKIKLKIRVTDTTWMISDVNPNGWLRAKLNNGRIHPLPNFLKIDVLEIKNKRIYFKIFEGKLKGQNASIKYNKVKINSYFRKRLRHKGAAQLTYDRSKKILSIVGLGSFKIKEKINPLPKGTYDLEIPYEPHEGGSIHQVKSRYSKTWFRIGHRGDHFLHAGRESLGCLTVTEIRKWTKLYNYLIPRRKDDRSVGTLIIK